MRLAVPIGGASAAWIQASQDRVTATSTLLRSIKSLKISSLLDVAFKAVHDLRVQELSVSLRYRRILTTSLGICECRNH
jgi:hypothetical protein